MGEVWSYGRKGRKPLVIQQIFHVSYSEPILVRLGLCRLL